MIDSDAWRNGRHCGHLISKVNCPHTVGSKEAEEWELGFKQGRQDLQDEFKKWKEDQVKNKEK